MLRIRATCPHSDRRSRSNREIALRDLYAHTILAPVNSDSPICNGKRFSPRLRVNRLVPPPGSNDPRDFASLHDDLSRRFSSSMKRSPLHHLRPVRLPLVDSQRTKVLSLLSFSHSDSFRDFLRPRILLCSVFNHFPKVMKPPSSVRSHPQLFNLTFSALLLKLLVQSHSPARLEQSQFYLGNTEQKSNYLASSTHSMRRSSTALDAGISWPKQRNN
jgi:hypothetical protein